MPLHENTPNKPGSEIPKGIGIQRQKTVVTRAERLFEVFFFFFF